MPQILPLFTTPFYRAPLSEQTPAIDTAELEAECLSIAEDDEAGQQWCEDNLYPGYTSYASLTDLPWRSPVFAALKEALDAHVARFIEELDWDLGERPVVLEDLWINILPPGGTHSGHIHPHSVISGTTYVALPEGAGALKLEDPRLPMMMAAPPRKKTARPELKTFAYQRPNVGEIFLWESWLRHEVMLNWADDDNRISVSFNYKWA
jgi:uncharacterized protein (TIGR02466 family)